MQNDEFVKAVRERTDLESDEEAEQTAFIVLNALAERISSGEAGDLYAQLPDPLKTRLLAHLPTDDAARRLSADDYVRRVASALNVDEETAEQRIRAVFDVVRKAVTQGEFEDVLSQLDRSYRGLVAKNAP
jgi:uncharacterized protein (DUF2267 family)